LIKEGHPGTGGFQNTSRQDQKRNILRHNTVKMLNTQNKEIILKTLREK
jgi:hypothetical protein